MQLVRFIVACSLHAAVACAGQKDPPGNQAPPPYSADFAPVLEGAPDRGRDPSVVALSAGGQDTCSAILVAPDIALTSRHCVADGCATRDPRTLDVWNGEDLEHASLAGHGLRVLTPEDCDADLAMVILDREIPGIHTSSFRRHGPSEGEHVRTVGFGRKPIESPSARLLRDHAVVRTTTGKLFTVGERPCIGPGGHVALDEDSGEIVGIASDLTDCKTSDPPIYVRVDAYFSFIDDALAHSGEAARIEKAAAKDAGLPDAWAPKKLPKSERPDKDFGSSCNQGSDCAAGVCVAEKASRYCSRSCSQTDRCPYGYRCVAVDAERKACIRGSS